MTDDRPPEETAHAPPPQLPRAVMTDAPLLETRVGAVAVLTLNRPNSMNALDHALRAAVAEAATRLAADDSVRVLVLTGAGSRAFCAGLDLKELGQSESALRGAEADPVLALEAFPRPIIVAINGVAVTGGFELALVGDVLLASSNARFADTHARMGIMPGWGLSQKLPRIIGASRAKEMSFTGNFIGAEQAERWGLVNSVVAPDALMDHAMALAQQMAEADPVFAARYKRLIDDGLARTLTEGRLVERAASRDWNARQQSADLERRRLEVTARGRAQR
jgi:enoyl-CoA hydratase